MVPEVRVHAANEKAVRDDGDFVLYWMVASRRTQANFGLERAIDWAQRLGRPLLVLEALRVGYRWASDRLHRFVLDGMRDNAAALEGKPVTYYPYVEPEQHAGNGLFEELAGRACVVVTDEFPCFFLPALVRVGARRSPVLLEAVDSNGVMPLRATPQSYASAYQFRRFLQKELPPHLDEFPKADPFRGARLPKLDGVPEDVLQRWPAADPGWLANRTAAALAGLPIDHAVGISPTTEGGPRAAWDRLGSFLDDRLEHYGDGRNHPDEDVSSGLSPYLHFGHLSTYQVFAAVAKREGWKPDHLSDSTKGKRSGWWGMSASAESFLDELITWRELGYVYCHHHSDYDRYDTLPDWALETLGEHEADPREHVYSLDDFERAATHDDLWNAAQAQIVRTGHMHNYLRMLWGKKILEWSATPRDALAVMIELNNKYGLDGRNPNSYSGIFWTLGRFDRPWGPERKIYGKIRYMTSDNTMRKLKLSKYLDEYAPERPFQLGERT